VTADTGYVLQWCESLETAGWYTGRYHGQR